MYNIVTNVDFAVVRYNTDGTLDNTFSTDRILTTAIGSSDDYSRSVAIQSDGKIVDKSGPVQIVADNKWISMIN